MNKDLPGFKVRSGDTVYVKFCDVTPGPDFSELGFGRSPGKQESKQPRDTDSGESQNGSPTKAIKREEGHGQPCDPIVVSDDSDSDVEQIDIVRTPNSR